MTKTRSALKRFIIGAIIGVLIYCLLPAAYGKPTPRSKFYNFDEQMIDGEVRKPTYFYANARDKVKFERLLNLKKSFMRQLFNTSKNPVFK
tara:strand:+ start:29 stop:301 length:273 start_codon:yes stop_codon:yes gene_type:complete